MHSSSFHLKSDLASSFLGRRSIKCQRHVLPENDHHGYISWKAATPEDPDERELEERHTTTHAYYGSSCVNTTISISSCAAFYSFDANALDSAAINFTYNDSQFLSTTYIPFGSHSFTIGFWFYSAGLNSTWNFCFSGECPSSTTDHFGITYRLNTPCEIYLNAILFCYFPFDPTSFLSDSGPNYLSATNSNVTQTTGRVNQGVQFSSSSSYITISGVNVLNALNNPFTISMWIKPMNLTGGGTLIHTSTQSDGLDSCFASWGFSSNGSFIVNFLDSLGNAIPMTLSSSFPLNQWTHVVQVFNSSNGNYLYMNGNFMFESSPVISNSCKSGSISMSQFFGVINEFCF
ncbi:unnamed protein product [Adineta ricciae]|uniref:LamG domain-containing protein n=2 Tax=Adineta ricciae TaxID=249248 RepID=A0A816F5P1_ADIRI|nr:unnamed protein product [Adineta ricciae]